MNTSPNQIGFRAPSPPKMGQLVDASGRPLNPEKELALADRRVARAADLVLNLRRQIIQAKYDAAQTFTGNNQHWSNSDNLGPHAVASGEVRRILRARSRYEIIENNPYLKGILLTICNDFVGSGPKLQITDKRLSKERKQIIEIRWQAWSRVSRLRQKLWRARLARTVDGETFIRAYRNTRRKFPIQLDFQVLEADRVTSQYSPVNPNRNEVDGVRFDDFENPLAYHILHSHPGDSYLSPMPIPFGGDWVDAKFVIHWFRQDRGWLRGIPELAPSLPLCALLRRYTLAIVRHAETAADITAYLETQSPPGTNPWTDGLGNFIGDEEPFDTFPIEMGTIMNLPFGHTIKQLEAVPLGVQYDEFVGSLLREICRPILTPYNVASGSSKDSNMASGVLDSDVYKGGQKADRINCDEDVLDQIFNLWWSEASLVPNFLGDNLLSGEAQFNNQPIEHKWRWDKIGLDHTDPAKVAQALQILHDEKFITDRDIQETYYNRDYEDWQEEVTLEEEFRLTLPTEQAALKKAEGPSNDPQAPGAASNNRNRAKSSSPKKATTSKSKK